MSNYDIAQLFERLDAIEKSQREFQKKIYAALLGEVDGNTTGLIPQHRQCQSELRRWKLQLEDLQAKVQTLEDYKREILAYGAGVLGVLIVAWEIARALWIK